MFVSHTPHSLKGSLIAYTVWGHVTIFLFCFQPSILFPNLKSGVRLLFCVQKAEDLLQESQGDSCGSVVA